MSLSQQTMLDLMALADGEVDGAERDRLEKLVAESAEARRVVEAMRSPALGEWLGAEMDDRAAASSADGIADVVMARLGEATAASSGETAEGGGVVRLASRPRGGARPQVVMAGAVGVIALAAGIAFYVSSARSHGDDAQAPVASVGTPSVDTVAPASAAHPSQGVEVDELDGPSKTFSVFEIALPGAGASQAHAAGPSSVVIMIDDHPGGK